jgi:hypothetical protein
MLLIPLYLNVSLLSILSCLNEIKRSCRNVIIVLLVVCSKRNNKKLFVIRTQNCTLFTSIVARETAANIFC